MPGIALTRVRRVVMVCWTVPIRVQNTDTGQSSGPMVLSQTLKDAKRRVNKELAHLTTGRISGSPARKAWDVNALAAELRPLLREFTTKAAPTRLSPRVKSAIR